MERPQAAPKHDPAERSCFGEEERPMSDQELERIEGAVSASTSWSAAWYSPLVLMK